VILKLGGTSDKEARATTEKRQEEVAMIQDKQEHNPVAALDASYL